MNSELTCCIHAVLLVLTKFLVVHERERCERLRRWWLSVPQHVNCVSAFASDTGSPLSEERVIAVQWNWICTLSPTCEKSQMKRDHPGNFVVVSKSSQTVVNVAQKLENTVQPVFMR